MRDTGGRRSRALMLGGRQTLPRRRMGRQRPRPRFGSLLGGGVKMCEKGSHPKNEKEAQNGVFGGLRRGWP